MTNIEFIVNQVEFCREKKYPVFLPDSGYCFNCGTDIIKALMDKGRTGREELITSCPSCHVSFCD